MEIDHTVLCSVNEAVQPDLLNPTTWLPILNDVLLQRHLLMNEHFVDPIA